MRGSREMFGFNAINARLTVVALLLVAATAGCASILESDAIVEGDGGLDVCVPEPESGNQIVAGVTFSVNLAPGESVTFDRLELVGAEGVEIVQSYVITDPNQFLFSSPVEEFPGVGDGIVLLSGASVAADVETVGVAATLALDTALDKQSLDDLTVSFTDSSGRQGVAAAHASFTFAPRCS